MTVSSWPIVLEQVVVIVLDEVIWHSGRPSLILLVFRCQLARAWSAWPDDH